ncbi:MAG: carboxymuconolactone decarboxylase family protein [Planctomycetota bacterium]|jgi:alkylhydroperoxidase/carboxymuconolactone decarboxylase family protein YurZ
MPERFALQAELWAALFLGEDARMVAAAAALEAEAGESDMRACLHLAHLFLGFPRVLRALNLLPPRRDEPAPTTGDPDRGEAVFREVYGEDAAPVLAHLDRLDAPFAGLVLEHAYGRTFGGSPLPLAVRERLSVLALLATACPLQARSHLRACLRHGVDPATLRADLGCVDWLDAATRAEAATWIDEEAGGLA